jgi:hypothetical protein
LKLRPKQDAITFSLDSNHKYKSQQSNYRFYNNIADTASITDWKVVMPSPMSVSVDIQKDSLPSDIIKTVPFEHAVNLSAIFSTNEPTTRYDRFVSGVLQMRVKTSTVDSIYSTSVMFIFAADPTSSVATTNTASETLDVFPNPASGVVHLKCGLLVGASCEIAIFDELGAQVQSVFSGRLDGSNSEFDVQLNPGIYYARMQSGAVVVTKKIVRMNYRN